MTKPLYHDPVVAEIHETRKQLLDDCNGDVTEFRRQLRERQAKSGRKIVHGPVPKRTEQSDPSDLPIRSESNG